MGLKREKRPRKAVLKKKMRKYRNTIRYPRMLILWHLYILETHRPGYGKGMQHIHHNRPKMEETVPGIRV